MKAEFIEMRGYHISNYEKRRVFWEAMQKFISVSEQHDTSIFSPDDSQ
jgi:hypothetical protein